MPPVLVVTVPIFIPFTVRVPPSVKAANTPVSPLLNISSVLAPPFLSNLRVAPL